MSNKDAPQQGNKPATPLSPIFGSHCRTQTFSFKPTRYDGHHIYYEAFMENPVTKMWTVRRISLIDDPKNRRVSTNVVKNGLSFAGAIALLNTQEKDLLKGTQNYEPRQPDAKMMGFIHFRAFAEREGYVFDVAGYPHPRPNPHTIPDSGTFLLADIESADKNIARTLEDFGDAPQTGRMPNTLFVFEAFNRSAAPAGSQANLATMRALDILDRYVQYVTHARDKMAQYCENYAQLGQGTLIADAEKALQLAEACTRQLKPYGVETREFERFILQMQVVCHVLHAQGLHDLMRRSLGDFAQNDAAFKDRLNGALSTYQKLDPTELGALQLKEAVLGISVPVLPTSINSFIDNYNRQRADFNPQQPTPPKNNGGPFVA